MMTIAEALALATKHHQSGNLAQAEHLYRQVLQADPVNAAALHLFGIALHQRGQHVLALDYLRQALARNPGEATFHFNLGHVYQSLRQGDQAVPCYRQALALQPGYVEAWNNLGAALRAQGKLDEAVTCYCQALHLSPQNAEAHFNLGNALREQGHLEKAITSYREALRLRPDFAEGHDNLGITLLAHDALQEAVACHRQAVRLRPDLAEAHNNLGRALREQGKLDEAAASCSHALRLKPNLAEAHLCLGQIWLLQGSLEKGWPEYEWRWRCQQFMPRAFSQPLWDGSALAGRTILLYAEQGLGDTLQFIRYASLVKQRGGRVLVECPPSLHALLARCPGIDQLLSQDGAPPAFDVQAPLLSLPGLWGTTLAAIPADVPYLGADADRIEHWRQWLATIPGFKVGICWQGNPENKNDRRRSVSLEQFAPLASVPGICLVSLQRGPGSEQLAGREQRFPVLGLPGRAPAPAESWMETAALISVLDLVITVDTAVAHLAGALARPAWVALPYAPDWRWLLVREDSPWYPTLRLFRQKQPGQWSEVFRRIAGAVLAEVH